MPTVAHAGVGSESTLAPLGFGDHVEEDQEAQGQDAPFQGQPRQASQHGARLSQPYRGPRAALSALFVGGSPEPWRRVGLIRPDSDSLTVSSVTLVVEASSPPGIGAWGFTPDLDVEEIDGIVVRRETPPTSEPPDGVLALDHVVVMTPDIIRTSRAFDSATGSELRRIRDAGGGVEQAFHKSHDVVIEIVSSRDAEHTALWGVVFVVGDIDTRCAELGPDVVSPPRDAVQAGRRIATIRSAAGLGVPVALMTPAS